jgi:hypothetical protein
MLAWSRTVGALLAVCSLYLLLSASALAGAPATVTVRVEGLSETRLPATQVTTTNEPVIKGGEGSCPGTSAAGALQLATNGNWSGQWFGGGVNPEGKFEGLGYSVETILGESYPFVSGSFWDVWVDNHEAQGLCPEEMQQGGQLLIFPCHFEEGKECPQPLTIEAPVEAGVGESVGATVKQYAAKGESSPAGGAEIAWPGGAAVTDAQGHATLTFASAGNQVLRVTGSSGGPATVRTEASVCVHAGNDGTCGTTGPSGANRAGTSTQVQQPPPPYKGPYAVVADITGPRDSRVYARGHAPRVLAGTVTAHTAVTSVSLKLRRRYRGRCFAYDGLRERFARAICGRGRFFAVSKSSSFNYLLPAALAPGRYVLDVEATDAAGNRTALARGSSRIVFYVR